MADREGLSQPMITLQAHDIRDIVNEPRTAYLLQKDSGCWNQICSCLDVIDDTELAIHSWVDANLNVTAMPPSNGGRYLVLYGLLQALYLQQDAIRHLCEALTIPYSLSDYPRLKHIRDVRNGSIGHPTKRGGKADLRHHFISRLSLDDPEGIDVLTVFTDGRMDVERIDIREFVKVQREDVSMVLSNVMTNLRQRFEEYMDQFKDDQFVDSFPISLGYAFEKLFEGFRDPERSVAGEWCINQVEDALTSFKDALRRRGMEIDTFDYVSLLYEELSYPVSQLRTYVSGAPSDILTTDTARIFTFYIQAKLNDLKELAIELDQKALPATSPGMR